MKSQVPPESAEMLARRQVVEEDEMLNRCARHLCWRKRQSPAEMLRDLADAVDEAEAPDTYGRGNIVADTEDMIAQALGKERALIFVTGVMAQLCALRLWCEEKKSRLVAHHPFAHFEEHEEGALSHLHRIDRVHIGTRHRLLAVDDIENAPPDLAAVVIELPQRDLGGMLPEFDALVEQCTAIHAKGAASHLDGARLFEATAYYQRTLAEVAAPFDSVYVSAYKGLGAFSGAFLAGDEAFIERARIWRRRHGGECFQLYPFAVAAREAFRQKADQFGAWQQHAVDIAAALKDVDAIRIRPEVPQANMMHVFIDVSAEAARWAAVELGRKYDVCILRRTRPTEFPRTSMFEFPVHDGAMEFSPEEVALLLTELVALGRAFDERALSS